MGRRGVQVVRSFWTLRRAGERLEAHLSQAAARSKQDSGGCNRFHNKRVCPPTT